MPIIGWIALIVVALVGVFSNARSPLHKFKGLIMMAGILISLTGITLKGVRIKINLLSMRDQPLLR